MEDLRSGLSFGAVNDAAFPSLEPAVVCINELPEDDERAEVDGAGGCAGFDREADDSVGIFTAAAEEVFFFGLPRGAFGGGVGGRSSNFTGFRVTVPFISGWLLKPNITRSATAPEICIRVWSINGLEYRFVCCELCQNHAPGCARRSASAANVRIT